jgi:hypothetical protein
MTPRSNVVPLRACDRKVFEGEVGFVRFVPGRVNLYDALATGDPSGSRLAVLRDRQISVCRRCGGAIAIAVRFLRDNALALTLGFIAGLLAVLVPAMVVGQVVK